MPHRKNIITLASLAIIGLFTATGCATRGRIEPEITPRATTRADTTVAQLNVAVNTTALEDEESKAVAERVENEVEGLLSASGFKINSFTADLLIAMSVDAVQFDEVGNAYRYEGEVRASARRTADGLLIGKKSFEAKGERQHGQSDALNALATELAGETGAWLVQTCTAAASELSAENITINRHGVIGNDSKYAKAFFQEVKDMEGVITCELIGVYSKARQMVFRVVYFKDKFPAGILNELATNKDLGMKPKD